MRTCLAVLSLVAACGANRAAVPPAPAPPAPPVETRAAPASPAAAPLADDTTVTTASGATLLAPKGWWLTQAADRVTLADPDRGLTAIFVEVADLDGAAAIAAAWQAVEPGFARTPAQPPIAPPPTGGWDAITRIDYANGPGEHRAVSALARRLGATTYVALVDGDVAAASRREAQLQTALDSLHPRDLRDESFAGVAPRPIDRGRAAELDAFIARARDTLGVPGAAVAVIEGGKVVYEKTIGVRELGRAAPITTRTLFLLASITKPMTTMMEAALVDRGVLAWDTPVTQLLPDFALGDPTATAALRLWHMSCACTGMPRQDLQDLFEYADVTPEMRLASMKTMKPSTGFGETFQYSNLMVAAGGFAAAHAYAPKMRLLDAYAAAMRALVFEPIGMTSTTIDPAAVARADHASPHALAIDGTPRAMPLAIEEDVLPIAPAGAVWTDLHDFERFALTELADGVAPDRHRVVSAANAGERRKPRVRVGADDSYGLGLDVGTFHGLPTIGHDGGAFGYGTMMFLLPDQQIAVLVLTNVRDGGAWEQLPFDEAVQRKVVEEIFGGKDVASAMVAYYAREQADAVAKAQAGVERDPDPAWVAGLAGTYHEASLGAVAVRAAAHGGIFDAGEWALAFGRRVAADGSASIVFLDPPFAGSPIPVTGDAAHPTFTIVDGQTTYVLTRAP